MKTNPLERRKFLGRVGEGMLVATVGVSLAEELGCSLAYAEADAAPKSLDFGKLEPLVAAMQETPLANLQQMLVGKLNSGQADLGKLIQAGALANARSFGGEDYIGFHTMMALKPAFVMAQQLPDERRALAVLKVLYRNTAQIHATGGRAKEKLKPVDTEGLSQTDATAEALRQAVRDQDWQRAEKIFAMIADNGAEQAWEDLLQTVEDGADVHRIVLAHRSWDTLDLIGMEHAETMLRQSLRYCLKQEKWAGEHSGGLRTVLPKLLDQHRLLDREPGDRRAEDQWIEDLSRTIFESTPEQAADAVASSLAEGIVPADIAAAISMAANQLVLRDEGRREDQVRPGKPLGSVHGDSIGVHASDSANAWRHMAKSSTTHHTMACLILAGFQVARDRVDRGGKFLEWKARPYAEQLVGLDQKTGEQLLGDLDGAIREQDQAQACALTHAYGAKGGEVRPMLDLLLRHATSVDGALHAEKYYLTTSVDFADARPAFRWRHLVGLARVTASEYGMAAAGYGEACELLKVEA
jgi:hypothetical protein